ncbi:MAG: SRPBCC domain-containing protein [Streptococcaceae bacterium]|jgi:hypothetical protein|nr:SRPBCC domain-containing protein [Streptococcaceae bacterium]
MIKHIVEVHVENVMPQDFFDFMTNPNDHAYRAWWPERHHEFHVTKAGEVSHLGDEVWTFENVDDKHQLKILGVITEISEPSKIVWQFKKFGVMLPSRLILTMEKSSAGLELRHETQLGFKGWGKIFDPLFRFYFNKSYRAALTEHCQIEWSRLALFLANYTER